MSVLTEQLAMKTLEGVLGLGQTISASKKYKEAAEKYKNAVETYSGQKGYEGALENAQKGAGRAAIQAGNKQAQAARGAGMSNAAAALMGGNAVAGNYLNEFNDYYNKAYGAGTDYITGMQQNYNNLTGQINSQRDSMENINSLTKNFENYNQTVSDINSEADSMQNEINSLNRKLNDSDLSASDRKNILAEIADRQNELNSFQKNNIAGQEGYISKLFKKINNAAAKTWEKRGQ